MLRQGGWHVAIITTCVVLASCSVTAQAASGPGLPSAAPVLVPAAISGSRAPMPTPAGLAARLGPLLHSKALGQASAIISDPASGTVLLNQADTTAQIPASATKLLTAVAALSVLGPDYRLRTSVVRVGSTVTLVGGGDPLLASGPAVGPQASMQDLAAKTAVALGPGARVGVQFDDSLFTGPDWAPGWSPNLRSQGEAAPVQALMTDEGRATPTSVVRVANPARAAAKHFAALLRANGVTVTGVHKGTAGPGATPLASVSSPTVSWLIERMLTDSDNNMAEALAHLAGGKSGHGASFAGGAAAIVASLQAAGVSTVGVTLSDGSGLSHLDRSPVTTMATVLTKAATTQGSQWWPINQGLPVAGFTGTLANRYGSAAARPARGIVRAKTGTLVADVTLAGVTRDVDGRVLVFGIMANKIPSVAAARLVVDHIAAVVTQCGCSAA